SSRSGQALRHRAEGAEAATRRARYRHPRGLGALPRDSFADAGAGAARAVGIRKSRELGALVSQNSAARCDAGRAWPAERRLHLAPHLHGKIVFVIGDVAPAQAIALREVALEPDPMRKPERQQTLRE